MRFEVWAPLAAKVYLVIEKHPVAMTKQKSGWWAVDTAHRKTVIDYQFMIDGGEPRPDPRSPFQPFGIHGPSRFVDHNQFTWHDDKWQAPPLAEGIVYELHIGTFTPEGTFEAAIERLDHLIDLGVTHVELMPVNEFPGNRGWGYDGVDLYAPYHVYGGPTGLQRLVDACHTRGLAVLLDVVYNHLGPSGNYLGEFGPYFTDRYSTPWGPAVNFDDAGSDEVRRFLVQNALMWLRDYHFDGLRIDAVHAILDMSAVHFLEQLSAEVEALKAQTGRHPVLIAESDLNNPRLVQRKSIGGYGLDAQWTDDFHHALHCVLTGERQGYYADFGRMTDLADAVKKAYVYDGKYSVHRDRHHGRSTDELSGHRFVAFLQNHDQVGNRAKGDRIGQLAGLKRQKIGVAVVMTSAFIPLIFQGEEWGAGNPFLYFTNHEQEELGLAVTEGRRREFKSFGWDPNDVPDPQDPETFRTSKLNWNELAHEEHKELLDWYRTLIGIRRSTPVLLDGRRELIKTRFDETKRWFLIERSGVATVCNLSGSAQIIPLESEKTVDVLASSDKDISVKSGGIFLPSDTVAIVRYEAQK
ncbi:MAG: malto-oligosyltrehalose trehalohydrolase [Deltaproteobacteria bacterium]|nr:malto-oligosyltrehalose trehalohydrolase [Deltaproteobacteria bacterium]